MKRIIAIVLALFVLTLALASCGAKEITSLTIDEGLVREYNVNDTPDFSGVKATAKYNDKTEKKLTAADLTFGTIDMTTPGTKKLTITYQTITINVDIVVKQDIGGGDEYPYIITGAELPSSITNRTSNSDRFTDKNKEYFVGDDNPYKLSLVITAVDVDTMTYVPNLSYVSVSMVYLVEGGNETLADETYVVINETNNTFDFTEDAIGKTFKIVTRPSEGISDDMIADVTATHTVKVVDGYNVTNAKELNLITNNDGKLNHSDAKQLDVVNTFLQNNGIVRPEKLAGVILHNDFTIQPSDLPAEYFCTYTNGQGQKITEFYDFLSVYYRMLDAEVPNFSIYGNYCTLYTYELPCVVAQGYGNQGNDLFSNSQLLKAETRRDYRIEGFDPASWNMNIDDLAVRDDNPNTNDTSASDRSMRGISAFMATMCQMNITNTNAEAFYMSAFLEYDYTILNLNKVNFNNAWQSHIFAWSQNDLQNSNDQAWESHKPGVLNIANSSIKTCGGPVILAQSAESDKPKNAKCKTIVNVDSVSELESWVTGQEAWFEALKATDIAMQIVGLDELLSNTAAAYNTKASFLKEEGDKFFMNLIYLNMASGTSLLSGADIDGKVTINDTVVVNQNEAENPDVKQYVDTVSAIAGQVPPVFETSAGGICFGNPDVGALDLDFVKIQEAIMSGTMPNPAEVMLPPSAECFQGDYITIYYNGVAILLEYMH